MIRLRRPPGGGYGRGAPPERTPRAWPRLAVLLLGVASLLPTGCASFRDPCGGGLFSNCRLFNGGLFRRDTVIAAPMVGEPFLSVPVEGAPIIEAPAEVIPAPAPVELLPAPIEGDPLGPIPAPATETTPTSGVSRPADSTQKTLYETLKPPGGTTTSRRSDPARAPATLSSRQPVDPAGPLLDLPPLTIPSAPEEAISEAISPPTPTEPRAADLAIDTRRDLPTLQPSTAGELPPKPVESGPISLAPGIARFKVVEAQLAGGSLPNAAGWSFLAEKGYRTALDLRERGRVSPGDDAAALHAGLRYVALPVTSETIGDEILERFEDEISMADGRPLYFFDDDGARASILWFLHLVVNQKLEPEAAVREVEELGPKDPAYWVAANVYLNERAARDRTTEPPAPAGATPGIEPPTPISPEQILDDPFAPEAIIPQDGPLALDAPGLDETSWRPMAAMLLTGLSLPLAYIGRGAFSGRNLRRLASLPAPARRLLSLPQKSDA